MKKHILFYLFLLGALSVQAKDVTPQQAKEAALTFFRSRGINPAGIGQLTPIGADTTFYLVHLMPQGWALVSGDDAVRPIMGYSPTGTLDVRRLPSNMQYLLDCQAEEITYLSKQELAPHPYWKGYTTASTRAVGNEVKPLIKVNWDQTSPFWNYCPLKNERHALVGCVAVALSQAMSVQRYPARPKGEVSYGNVNYGNLSINFDAEKGYDWDAILAGSNNYDEAARLLYHAGMAVRMEYGEEGSGVSTNNIYLLADALRNHFSYPDNVTYIWREQYKGDWEQLLVNELTAGRAIVYNGVDRKNNAGHSFNIDGYDGSGSFHVNWGWGGYGNAYFAIDNLRDKQQGLHFDDSHVIVIGIGGTDKVLQNISLSNEHIEEGLPAGSIVGQIQVNGETPKASFSFQVSGVNGAAVPFTIEKGMLRTTEVLHVSTKERYDLVITVSDSESNTTLTQVFFVYVRPWESIGKSTSLRYDREKRQFILHTKHNVSYTLTTAQGTVLQQGELSPLPQLTIDAQSLPAGANVLTLRCTNEEQSIQLITHKEGGE